MRAGEFPDGSRTLRAKIDMASPNLNMRDPVMYRIKRAHHHRTGDKWCIYPSYDWTHGQSDSIEGITHSICTLEFENHRPLYDWFCRELEIHHPRQIEFARLNLSYAVMSKRKLLQLVQEKHVAGWDDPRMLTIRGLRRRGYTAEAISAFCERIGVAKFNSTIDMAWLENAIREDLNERAPRAMAVLRPLKVVLTNFPEGEIRELESANHPQKPEMGTRKVPLTREIYIEQEDFMEEAPKKFFRLKPGGEVRLRFAGIIKCDEVIKDAAGRVTELRVRPRSHAEGEGDDPLGLGAEGVCRGGTVVRPLVQGREPGRRAAGRELSRQSQSELTRGLEGRQAGAVAGEGGAGGALSVRTRRVFLRGPSGFEAGPTGVQPHRDAAR